MQEITLLAKKLRNRALELPHLHHLTLQTGEMFGWNHTACAITYNPTAPNASSYLLHEFGHAVLNHRDYRHDIELIRVERSAWDTAATIANEHNLTISEDLVEDALDSYRDWLHSRSCCPTCNSTGIQVSADLYRCASCRSEWRVNEARACALRRYPTKKHPR